MKQYANPRAQQEGCRVSTISWFLFSAEHILNVRVITGNELEELV